MADVKTAVSEAVTNAIVHGYQNKPGKVRMQCTIEGNTMTVVVEDSGIGIEDVEKARQPFLYDRPREERSGMGFAVMEAFMDSLHVESSQGRGTRVEMKESGSWNGSDGRCLIKAQANLELHNRSMALIERAQAGDDEAKEALVKAHTALVKSVVKRFLGRGYEYDDLFQLLHGAGEGHQPLSSTVSSAFFHVCRAPYHGRNTKIYAG